MNNQKFALPFPIQEGSMEVCMILFRYLDLSFGRFPCTDLHRTCQKLACLACTWKSTAPRQSTGGGSTQYFTEVSRICWPARRACEKGQAVCLSLLSATVIIAAIAVSKGSLFLYLKTSPASPLSHYKSKTPSRLPGGNAKRSHRLPCAFHFY